MKVLLLILLLPLAEIAGFVLVGGEIGVLNTLALVILTGLAGIFLVRRQGLDTLRKAQMRMDRGEPPVREAFDGVCLALAGILLIIPGFLTDILGVLLFLPPVRDLVFRRAQVRVEVAGAQDPRWRGAGQPRYRGPDVIEGDFTEVRPPGEEDRTDELPPPDSRWRPPPKE